MSLRLKTIAFVSVVMAVSAISLGTVFEREWATTQHEQFVEHAKDRVNAAAATSQWAVFAKNLESLEAAVEYLSGAEDVMYVSIRDEDGETLAQAGAPPPTISPARLAEVNAVAVQSMEARVYQLDGTQGRFGRIEVSVPILWERPIEELTAEEVLLGVQPEVEEQLIGVVQMGFSDHKLVRQQAETRKKIALYTLLAAAAAVAMTALLSSFVINPIQRLAAATRQVAAGDLTIRVPVRTGDEIGALAESFNAMTDELRESREELDSYHRTLEFQVAERTDALRMANEELRRINDELATTDRLKSEFLANMSHELRTPLNAIIGFSELLNDQVFGPLNEKQLRYVENVHSSGRHLLNLINEILDLAKVESGKLELQMEPFNPEAAITDITNIVRSLAQQKHIKLMVEAPQALGVIVADSKRFKQILYNLLSNAIKFTPDHGDITLYATLQPKGPTPQWLQIAVTDSGIGIAESDQARVFNEFEQVDGTHSREYAGTGLGLALTRTLVQLHGGTISLESTLGHGSTFTVTLPLNRPETEDVSGPERDAATEEDAPVLYVGSSTEEAWERLHEFLGANGFSVHGLRQDEDLLARAHELKPRVILLDLTDDPATAYDLWHILQADSMAANIPTILFVPPGVEAEGFALCAAAHFSKPVARESLLSKLRILAPSDRSSPARILIVDDDPQYVELTTAMLETEGYEVFSATGGAAGIDALSRHKPDMLLLDLMMPEVNGFEVVAHMRNDPDLCHIPVLIITAKDLTAEDMRALNGHVASIAQKGLFTREGLLREIRQAYTHTLAQE